MTELVVAPNRRVSALVQPADPWRGRAAGPAPYRVLYIGTEFTTSGGVATHDLGLLGQLARGMQRLLSHGADVFGVPAPVRTLGTTAAFISDLHPSRADVVVLEVPRFSQRDWDRQQKTFTSALHTLCDRLPKYAHLLLITTASDSAAQRDMLDAACFELPRTAQAVMLPQLEVPSREGFAQWGSSLAEAITPHLRYPFHWSLPDDQPDADQRHQALQALPSDPTHWHKALQRLVTLAASAYGTQMAAVSLHDHGEAHYMLTAGSLQPHSTASADSVCSTVLGRYAGLILGDAQADSRFRDLPIVASGTVRFYAGYRLLDAQGVPIGVVCVNDPAPREVLSQDIDVLRDIAAVMERRIWELSIGQLT